MAVVTEASHRNDVRRHRRLPSPHLALVAVSAAYLVAVVVGTSQRMTLTYDEVVYASQVARDAPAAVFTAPRARGMTLLVAPVVMVTQAPFALRAYLVCLSALFLYLAFRPWLPVFARLGDRFRYVPPAAAGLLGTLWITVIYGSLAYPNLWLTFALVAGVGYAVRSVTEPRPSREALVGVVVAFGLAFLLRPTDATAVAGPVVLAMLVIPAWRRVWALVAIAGGVVIGWGAWIAESFASYGGPLQRLQRGGEINESGLTNSIPKTLAALDGPEVLCRPSSVCAGIEAPAVLWWLLLPVLVAVAIFLAFRARWLTLAIVITASAVAPATAYLFLIDYSAPRFLLPTYGLLALLAATTLLWAADRSTARSKLIAQVLLVVGLVGHAAIQVVILDHAQARLERVARGNDSFARFLRDEGVQAPCLVWGGNAVPVAYQLNCASMPTYSTMADPERDEAELLRAVDQGMSVAIRVNREVEQPAFLDGWRQVEIPGSNTYVAYLSPGS